ncbi:MAG: TetR/AcrR family transcriptional regulator [Gracilibacteraceae bacterium]|jgi:AcrR family transcriptional regulator|nr:TetR/AcrR family transcriptional regulator [Gracilibacteraceae bacterium]
MHDNFVGLKEEKRDKIINAALLEFAAKGYGLASTNEIVKAAGISKGALFHYFATKKDLFLFLCDYTSGVVSREFYEQIGHCDGDLLIRYRRAAMLKGAVYKRYPPIFEFIKRLTTENAAEIAGELKDRLETMVSYGYECLLGNLDLSLFREDVPARIVRDLITWALENYGNRSQALVGDQSIEDIDVTALNADFDEYLEALRKCFYKQ